MAGLSIRGYARHRGVSHTAVRKALEDERITKGTDGKIDPALADRSWEARTDPRKPSNSVTGEPKHRRKPGGPSSPRWSDSESPPSAPAGTTPADGRVAAGYAASEALRSQFKARREKIALDRELGKSVDASETRRAAFTCHRRARDLFLALPDRLAPRLAVTEDEDACRAMLEEQIGQILEELKTPTADPGAAPVA